MTVARILRRLLVAVLVIGLPLLPAAPASAAASSTGRAGALAYAVTADGQLALVALEAPEAPPLELAPITGLTPGDVVRSIDVDPADGALRAVAVGADGASRSYVLDTDPARFGTARLLTPAGPILSAPGLLGALGALGLGLTVVLDIDVSRTGLLAAELSVAAPLTLLWVDLSTGVVTRLGQVLFGVVAITLALLGIDLPVPQVPLIVLLPTLLLAGGAVELIRSRRRSDGRARPAAPSC